MSMARMMRILGNRLSVNGSHRRNESKLHHQKKTVPVL